MKKPILYLLFAFILFVSISGHSQHGFYTTSAYTYGISKNSYSGSLITFDSLFANAKSLHKFDSITGGTAMGSVIQATNGKLYGLTFYGGAYDRGVLFEYDPTIDSLQVKQSLTERGGSRPLHASNGKIYFCTGGAGGNLMEYDITTNTLTSLKYLPYPEAPKGSIIEAKGKIYGVENIGGPLGWGRLFEYNLTTKAFRYAFNFGTATGNQPQEAPVFFPDDGKLYGIVRNPPNGTPGNAGALYSFNPTNNAYAILLTVPDEIGMGAFLTVAPNKKIYGLSFQGGTDASGGHYGAIFEYTPATNTIRLVHSFGNQPDGSFTGSGYTIGGMMLAADGKMYGVTASHVFQFDYKTDKVTAIFQTSSHPELGFEINTNGRFEEVCLKPAYTYFKDQSFQRCLGESFSYDVESDNAKTFVWKKDGSLLAGQKSKTLQLTSVTAGDAGTYTCVMTNTCGTTETLGTVTLEVNTTIPAPTLAAAGETVFCEGNTVTLTGNTTGTWNTGATTETLTVSTTGEYHVTTSSPCGTETSNTITVVVNPMPVIQTQPQDQEVLAGETATFTLTTQNTSDQYQWQIKTGDDFEDITDDDHYAGTTSKTLQIANAQKAEDGHHYRCTATTVSCSTPSATVTLHVTTPPLPPVTVGTETPTPTSASLFYPNPVTDILYLTLPEGMSHHITIRDTLGRIIYTGTASNHQIQTANWSPGLYILEVNLPTQSHQGRFLKV